MTHFWNSQNAGARRSLLVAGGVCVALAMATFVGSGGLAAQRTGRVPPAGAGDQNGPLWTLATPLDDGRQMLLVVDQQARALAIYHVDPTNGTLTLKSTRDISWDMLVEDFNCQDPRPAVLKKMLEMPK